MLQSSRRRLCSSLQVSTIFNTSNASQTVTAAEMAAMPELQGAYEQPRVYFKPSCNPRLADKPSVLFGPPPAGTQAIEGPSEGLGAGQLLYKITSPTCDYVSLRLALLRAGFRRITAAARCDGLPANVVWGKSMPPRVPSAGSPKERAYFSTRLLHPHQRFNHFPSSHANLGCKAGMAMNLNREMARTRAFHPKTMLYPSQKGAIRDWIAQSPRHERFIWKPARGSCGRGIMICGGGADGLAEATRIEEGIARKIRECEATNTSPAMFKHYVIQKYIDEPMLIDGKKFDLRLYVAVTSFSPKIVAYRHQLGFARFAAAAYKDDAIREKFSHLTNFSIGRKVFMDGLPSEGVLSSTCGADCAATREEAINAMKEASEKASELKWTLDRLNAVFEKEPQRTTCASGVKVDKGSLWASVDHVIRETLLAAQPRIARKMAEQNKAFSDAAGVPTDFSQSYFELYGFDIMFDSSARPWLIEVNTLPSLESSSIRDYHVKTSVVTDLLNMAMIVPFDRTEAERGLFATVHHTAAYSEGGGAAAAPCVNLPEETSATQSAGAAEGARPSGSAAAAPAVQHPREPLPPPSAAAQRFLIGCSERFDVPSAVSDEARAYRERDEDIYKGGFIRIV